MKNFLFSVKDYVTGSDLTERRKENAKLLEKIVQDFKTGIEQPKSLDQLNTELNIFINKLSAIEKLNNELSSEKKKSQNSGRLHEKIQKFKTQIQSIRTQAEKQASADENDRLKKEGKYSESANKLKKIY